MLAPAMSSPVTDQRATILVSDCRHHADLTRKLGSAVQAVHRFGCARVYVMKPVSGPISQDTPLPTSSGVHQRCELTVKRPAIRHSQVRRV